MGIESLHPFQDQRKQGNINLLVVESFEELAR